MLRAGEHGGPEKNAFDSGLFLGFRQRTSSREKAKRWVDFFAIYLPVIEWLNHHVQRSEAWFFICLMVYANELIFSAFTLKQCSSRLVIEILKISWLRLRCWRWVWVKIIMSRAIKREPKSPICVVGIGIKSWLNCLEKLSFFGCWKSLSAASKCRKTRPCDHRISKFYGGACPRTPLGIKALWALPILCPVVKLSCPVLLKTLINPLH